MTVNSEEDLAGLQRIGKIVGLTLQAMIHALRPGITTAELDEIGRRMLEQHGARSAPQLMYDFPGATCISVNEEAAHGIPGERVIQAGDLVNIDVSAELDGLFADTGASTPVAPVSAGTEKLCACGHAALKRALAAARAGQRLNAIGQAVENEARRRGFNLIRDLTGHGVGRKLHEAPREIYNYYNPFDPRVLQAGQVLAIEPFITPGSGRIHEERDGWTLKTSDGARLVQYEHTIVVTRGKPLLLTAV